MAAVTSTSFSNFRSNSKQTSSNSSGSSPACGKIDGVAMWFVNGFATAFFASLQRCSCIRIATDEDGDDLPLILDDADLRLSDGGSTSRRKRLGKGKKSKASVED